MGEGAWARVDRQREMDKGTLVEADGHEPSRLARSKGRGHKGKGKWARANGQGQMSEGKWEMANG